MVARATRLCACVVLGHYFTMVKLVGPALIILIIAATTVIENSRSHAPARVSDWVLWTCIGLLWGTLLVGGMFAVFAPLAWLARRGRRP